MSEEVVAAPSGAEAPPLEGSNPPGSEVPTLIGGEKATEQPNGEVQTEKPDAKPEGAPEAYDLKGPEGAVLDVDALGKFTAMAKDMNLTNESAQKLVDFYAQHQAGLAALQAEAQTKRIEGWADEARSDKEIGGLNLEATVSSANKVLSKFGTPGLMALLAPPSEANPNGLGLGNHPEMVKVFAKIQKAIGEDAFVGGGKPSVVTDPAKRLYPDMI